VTVTGAPGSAASVTNSGTPNAAVFNFSIPQGIQGQQGGAALLAEEQTVLGTGSLQNYPLYIAPPSTGRGYHVYLMWSVTPAALGQAPSTVRFSIANNTLGEYLPASASNGPFVSGELEMYILNSPNIASSYGQQLVFLPAPAVGQVGAGTVPPARISQYQTTFIDWTVPGGNAIAFQFIAPTTSTMQFAYFVEAL
jgi:hypothetical protein